MKQTAVEWLVDYIENQNKNGYEFHPKYNEHIVQQAKEMEEQQQGYSEEEVKQAYTEGSFAQLRYIDGLPYIDRDRWFEQFKNK